jgi:hypothetical protein
MYIFDSFYMVGFDQKINDTTIFEGVPFKRKENNAIAKISYPKGCKIENYFKSDEFFTLTLTDEKKKETYMSVWQKYIKIGTDEYHPLSFVFISNLPVYDFMKNIFNMIEKKNIFDDEFILNIIKKSNEPTCSCSFPFISEIDYLIKNMVIPSRG